MLVAIATCEILLLGLLIAGAVLDIATFRLPNWLTAATAALALPWLLLTTVLWPGMALHLLAGAIMMGIGILAFRFNLMGGGDAKWLGSLALWTGLNLDLARFLILTTVFGGILGLVVLLIGRLGVAYGLLNGKQHLPYGVAIALAGLDFWLRRGQLGQQLMALYGS
ncbi:prepilin peptidase [Dongia sp.]|uniref:prepilin peptidase n=1 Tax=Dongia sp. TaxID=1977262 RepID=UPI0035AE28D8